MVSIEEREEAVRKFVMKNDSCSEGAVIRYLIDKEICSKDPTRATIKKLIGDGDILLKRDKRKNNKTHHLSINTESEFYRISEQILNVEKKIEHLPEPIHKIVKSPEGKITVPNSEFLLLNLHLSLIGTYMYIGPEEQSRLLYRRKKAMAKLIAVKMKAIEKQSKTGELNLI